MAPTPIAEGTLASTPFAHVVLSVHRRKLTGTLAIWPDEERPGQDRVRFEDGVPVAARLLESAETLERGLLPLFRRARAPYAFYDADLVGAGDGVLAMRCEPFALIAAALRGGGRDDVVTSVLGEFGSFAVTVAAGFDASAFRLVPKETSLVDFVRAEPDTVARLIERSGDEKTARRVLYLLAITRHLERSQPTTTSSEMPQLPGLESVPPPRATFAPSDPSAFVPPARSDNTGRAPTGSSMSSPRPGKTADKRRSRMSLEPETPPSPPAGLSADHATRWADLVERIIRSDAQNFFEVLGVDESSGPDEIRDAYFDAVKRIHPDRLPPDLAPLRSFVEKLFQQATEARETLEDGDKRLKYVSTIRQGGGTPQSDRKMMAVLSSAYELDKATVLANLGKWSEVLDVLEDAKALDATQPDIFALEAWALFNLLGLHPSATFEHILALTDLALADTRDGYHERALYTRALVYKRQARADDAMAIFRRITERSPRNLDAAREVRLHEMRVRDPSKSAERPSAPPKDGLLSKLFGGKK
jgi:hypothetical protein